MSAAKTKGKNQKTNLNNAWQKRTTKKFAIDPKEVAEFEDVVEQRLGYRLRPFQVEAVKGQLAGRHVLIHASTGSGKTAVAAVPHFHPSTQGMKTIMVSPLIALQDEQVKTFEKEFGLSAIAVNSTQDKSIEEMAQLLISGSHQIILISPEKLLAKIFVDHVLRRSEFSQKILAVVVDEAHVVSLWGSGFRKKYGELGIICAFLPRNTSIVAMSATLTGRVQRDVLKALHFPPTDYIKLNMGNERPNVSLTMRMIENPLNSLTDLDFIVPRAIQDMDDIPKTFVYADNIVNGIDIEDHLTERLPENMWGLGIVRCYNAAFSSDYRKAVMDLFKQGRIRILICTDAAGMGCNIPDIDVVVQWKMTSSLSSFIQRAGRAARDPRRQGRAILLFEKRVQENLGKGSGNQSKSGAKTVNAPRKGTVKEKTAKKPATKGNNSFLNTDAEDEGLETIVLAQTCRRELIASVYGNELDREKILLCCDVCNPELLELSKPGKPPSSTRSRKVKRGEPFEEARQRLNAWRTSIITRDFQQALFGPSAILSDDMIDLLTSVGNIKLKSFFEELVGRHWGWYSEYGTELFALVSGWEIPKQTKAPNKSLKRARVEVTLTKSTGDKTEQVDGPATSAKRARTSVVTGRRAAGKESESNVASSSRLNLIPRIQIGQPHTASAASFTPPVNLPENPYRSLVGTSSTLYSSQPPHQFSTGWASYYPPPYRYIPTMPGPYTGSSRNLK